MVTSYGRGLTAPSNFAARRLTFVPLQVMALSSWTLTELRPCGMWDLTVINTAGDSKSANDPCHQPKKENQWRNDLYRCCSY